MGAHVFEVEPGVDLFYIDEGTGLPLVFVPGWMFSVDVFDKQIAHFSGNHRVIAIDPRNHGKSSFSLAKNRYRFQGEDIGKLLTYLGVEQAILIGWSFGGMAVWSHIEQSGLEHVCAVVTIDVAPKSLSSNPTDWTAGVVENLITDHNSNLDTNAHYRAFMNLFCENLLLDRNITIEEKERFSAPALRFPAPVADELYTDGWLADKTEVAKLVDSTVPSLAFVADSRAEVALPYLKSEFPHTEVHIFGHHMMFYEYPDQFNSILGSFLEQHGL